MTAVLHVIVWILIVIGIVLASLLCLTAAVLWSTVTADIAVNKHKALVTLNIWYVIRHTFEIPISKLVQDEIEKSESKEDEEANEETDAESSGAQSEKWLGLIDKAELKEEVRALWDKESYTFDFQLLYDLIEKYTKILSDCKYGIGMGFRHLKYKIRLKRLDLYIRYGTGEPDKTGIAYGVMHGGVGALTPILNNYLKISKAPRLFLEPDYVHKVFDFEAGCVLKTRPAYAVNAFIIGFVSYKLRKINKI